MKCVCIYKFTSHTSLQAPPILNIKGLVFLFFKLQFSYSGYSKRAFMFTKQLEFDIFVPYPVAAIIIIIIIIGQAHYVNYLRLLRFLHKLETAH